jgi:hypothetical protein
MSRFGQPGLTMKKPAQTTNKFMALKAKLTIGHVR